MYKQHVHIAMYKQHAQFNLFIALSILMGSIYYFLYPSRDLMLTFTGTFAYSTLFMYPDMNLANQIRLMSIRRILSIPFRSYSKVFSHRELSHNLILGSFTRIAWLLAWGALAFLIFYKSLPTKGSFFKFYKIYQPFILYVFGSICLDDWGHLLLDMKEVT